MVGFMVRNQFENILTDWKSYELGKNYFDQS